MTNSTSTFTPTWSGFSTPPTGDVSYIDFGAFVIMWIEVAMFGTSNSIGAGITNLPAAIAPSSTRLVPSYVLDDGKLISGAAQITATGIPLFTSELTNTIDIKLNSQGCETTGNKGLAAGWMIIYAK